jgi:hypothetical protein
MSTEREMRVWYREMPLDGFLGLLTTQKFRSHLDAQLTLGQPFLARAILEEWEQVEAMRKELDRSQRPMDGATTGEWVICLPVRGDSFSAAVAVVRKYANNGNTYVATSDPKLGALLASELLPPGGSFYDRFADVER